MMWDNERNWLSYVFCIHFWSLKLKNGFRPRKLATVKKTKVPFFSIFFEKTQHGGLWNYIPQGSMLRFQQKCLKKM